MQTINENEFKQMWKEEIRDVKKCLHEAEPMSKIPIVKYKSKNFSITQIRDALECKKRQNGVISKLKSGSGAFEGYLVQWEEVKEEKKHREFNYNQLRRGLDGK